MLSLRKLSTSLLLRLVYLQKSRTSLQKHLRRLGIKRSCYITDLRRTLAVLPYQPLWRLLCTPVSLLARLSLPP